MHTFQRGCLMKIVNADESVTSDVVSGANILDRIWNELGLAQGYITSSKTEKHLAGEHDQQSHAGGKGGATDLHAQLKDAKAAVSQRMSAAKKSGDYSGMSTLRRRIKDLEAEITAGGGLQTSAAAAQAPVKVATKRDLDSLDPDSMYKKDDLAVSVADAATATTFRKTLGGENGPVSSAKVRGREIAKLVGAPDESQVYIEKDMEDDSAVLITVYQRRFMDDARFTLRKSDDGPELHIESIDLEDDMPKGTGTAMVWRMVRESRKLGVQSISLTALRDNISNGYYTWARLGFDGFLPDSSRKRLQGTPFRHAKMVSDLMRSAEGRAWWKENGETMPMSFDPNKGSFNSAILESYVGDLLGK